MSISNLNSLLDKMGDWDKDERYMATNDLCNELSKDLKIDENMEKRICASVLKQLGNIKSSLHFYSLPHSNDFTLTYDMNIFHHPQQMIKTTTCNQWR